MQKFLQIIKGKKSLIISIVSATTFYGISKGWIAKEEADYIAAIILALGGTSFVANKYTK